ncbi:MAG: methyltransferase domain-containing protein [Elusimicrobiota bacterium]
MFSYLLHMYFKSKIKFIRLRRMLAIPRGKKVIDIGGGDGPFPRADILCEKFFSDDSERTSPILRDRPLVLGDIECLPFADKSFDFVYCAHVLEHTNDPAKAIAEIMRISNEGYIEVPSEYLELTATSTPSHLWVIRLEAGKLVFRPKLKASINEHVDKIFHGVLWKKDHTYMAFHWKNYYPLFNIPFNWKSEIPFEVHYPEIARINNDFSKGSVGNIDELKIRLCSNKSDVRLRKGLRGKIKSFIQKKLTDTSPLWFFDVLACPTCKEALHRIPDFLSCQKCSIRFPLVNNTPVLLAEFSTPV